jgi:hypothetical protein
MKPITALSPYPHGSKGIVMSEQMSWSFCGIFYVPLPVKMTEIFVFNDE